MLNFGEFFGTVFPARTKHHPAPPHPAVPSGMRVYVVGDIHGEAKLFERLCRRIHADRAETDLDCVLILLGDYIDRGPRSRTVLDMLASEPAGGLTTRCLLGNHEAAMLEFLKDPIAGARWLDFGGIETLASYGVTAPAGTADPSRLTAMRDALLEVLPQAHREFLENLETMIILGDYAFVHAGINPRRPLDRQEILDLLTIRGPFLRSSKWHGKRIVHGHTIVPAPELLPNRIALDTGAYASGLLSGLVLEGAYQRLL